MAVLKVGAGSLLAAKGERIEVEQSADGGIRGVGVVRAKTTSLPPWIVTSAVTPLSTKLASRNMSAYYLAASAALPAIHRQGTGAKVGA